MSVAMLPTTRVCRLSYRRLLCSEASSAAGACSASVSGSGPSFATSDVFLALILSFFSVSTKMTLMEQQEQEGESELHKQLLQASL